jgi:hypothetical protein
MNFLIAICDTPDPGKNKKADYIKSFSRLRLQEQIDRIRIFVPGESKNEKFHGMVKDEKTRFAKELPDTKFDIIPTMLTSFGDRVLAGNALASLIKEQIEKGDYNNHHKIFIDATNCGSLWNESISVLPDENTILFKLDENRADIKILPPLDDIFHPYVFESEYMMKKVRDRLAELVTKDKLMGPILLCGPAGSGKTILSEKYREFRENLTGCKGQTIPCGTIPEDLLNSEIGGHVEGSFTGANKDKPGAVKNAERGALVLEEFGKLKPSQKNSFNELFDENAKVVPVGGEPFVPECHIIVNMEENPWNSGFPHSLISRCEIIKIKGLNDKERFADIFPILESMMKQQCEENKMETPLLFDKKARDYLVDAQWPFNARSIRDFVSYILRGRIKYWDGDGGYRVITSDKILYDCYNKSVMNPGKSKDLPDLYQLEDGETPHDKFKILWEYLIENAKEQIFKEGKTPSVASIAKKLNYTENSQEQKLGRIIIRLGIDIKTRKI